MQLVVTWATSLFRGVCIVPATRLSGETQVGARLGNTWTITLGKDLTSSLLGIFILFYHQIFVRILLASYLEEILWAFQLTWVCPHVLFQCVLLHLLHWVATSGCRRWSSELCHLSSRREESGRRHHADTQPYLPMALPDPSESSPLPQQHARAQRRFRSRWSAWPGSTTLRGENCALQIQEPPGYFWRLINMSVGLVLGPLPFSEVQSVPFNFIFFICNICIYWPKSIM